MTVTVDEAARSLADEFSREPWFTTVGVGQLNGEPCLYLYVQNLRATKLKAIRKGWAGYPVEIRRLGKARPFPRTA